MWKFDKPITSGSLEMKAIEAKDYRFKVLTYIERGSDGLQGPKAIREFVIKVKKGEDKRAPKIDPLEINVCVVKDAVKVLPIAIAKSVEASDASLTTWLSLVKDGFEVSDVTLIKGGTPVTADANGFWIIDGEIANTELEVNSPKVGEFNIKVISQAGKATPDGATSQKEATIKVEVKAPAVAPAVACPP